MLLEYDLSVVGTANIDRAFASIERRAALHNVRMQQMFGGESRMRGGASSIGTSQAQAKLDRSAELSAQRQARAHERAQLSAERRITQERERAQRQMFSLRMRHLRQEDAERRRMDAREMRERERTRSAMLGNATRSAGGALRGVGSMAVGSLGIFGGFAAAGAVGENLNLGRRYRELAINSRGTGQAFAATPQQIGSAVSAESIRTGTNRAEILGGLEAYVTKTGDIQGAIANLKNFSDFAIAFKSNAGDIATAAATLQQQFGITDAGQVSEALTAFGLQGRSGAFELVDIASQLPEIGSAAKRFGLEGLQGATTVGGLAQLAIRETGSASEATTAVQQMFNQLLAKSGVIQNGKAFGGRTSVDVFEDGDTTGNARNINSVLEDVISASGGRADELLKIFDVRGVKAVSGLVKAYKDASLAAGGGDAGDAAGRRAIQATLAEATDVTGKFADVQRDVAIMMEDDSIRLAQAHEELKQALGDALLPAVKEVTAALIENKDDIKAFISGMGEVVSYLIENPFKGIGAIVLAKVTADIATAAIGEAIKGQLLRAMAGGGGGGVAGGAAAGAARGGLLVAGGLVGGAALADEGLQAAEEYVTGKPSTSGGIFGTMTGFGPAIEGLHRSAQMEGAPEWVKKASDFVRNPVDTLTASADDIAKAIQSGELKVRVVNPGDMVAAQPMNRSNSPTQPR